MDSSKAQEELTKIGIGNRVYLQGNLDGFGRSTSRIERLISFDFMSVTIENQTKVDFKERIESEVVYFSNIDSISKPADSRFGGGSYISIKL